MTVSTAPTSFALSTSLLSMSLPRPDCKKHVAVFAAATPLAAIASYATLSLGGTQLSSVTGIALLLSVGTLLDVLCLADASREEPFCMWLPSYSLYQETKHKT